MTITALCNMICTFYVHPDIMNIIIKYKCGMTVCDEMHMYDILVKYGFLVSRLTIVNDFVAIL